MKGVGPKAIGLWHVLFFVVPMVLMLRFPYIKDFTVTSATIVEGQLHLSGSMRVHFTNQAWKEFGYKDGNFYYFNQWWQQKVCGLKYGPLRLVSISWTLLEHTTTYDELGFTAILERKQQGPRWLI